MGWIRGSWADRVAHGATFGAALKLREIIWGAIMEAIAILRGTEGFPCITERHHRGDYLSDHAFCLTRSGNAAKQDEHFNTSSFTQVQVQHLH